MKTLSLLQKILFLFIWQSLNDLKMYLTNVAFYKNGCLSKPIPQTINIFGNNMTRHFTLISNLHVLCNIQIIASVDELRASKYILKRQWIFCHKQQMHCWSYFAISSTRLVELVTWQRRNNWISVLSLSYDLKP